MDVIKHIINTSQEEVIKINMKEKLNQLDKIKMMIYANIHTVFSKMEKKKDA